MKLPSDILQRCVELGDIMTAHLMSGGSPQSRAVSYRGAENNPLLQAKGKMAECIFCLTYGLDPEPCLRWHGRPDPGFDINWGGLRIDVKQTELPPNYRNLIWSVAKAEILATKRFDILALVKCNERGEGFVKGWLFKEVFQSLMQTAGNGYGPRLDPGTLYVDESKLRPPELLAPLVVAA